MLQDNHGVEAAASPQLADDHVDHPVSVAHRLCSCWEAGPRWRRKPLRSVPVLRWRGVGLTLPPRSRRWARREWVVGRSVSPLRLSVFSSRCVGSALSPCSRQPSRTGLLPPCSAGTRLPAPLGAAPPACGAQGTGAGPQLLGVRGGEEQWGGLGRRRPSLSWAPWSVGPRHAGAHAATTLPFAGGLTAVPRRNR